MLNTKVIKLTIHVVLLLSILGCNSESEDMGLSILTKKPEKKSYVIFSPLEGVLTKGGKPMADTKIMRELRWNTNDDGIKEYFQTDANGYFKLPLHEETFDMSALTQFVANQYVSIESDSGTDYLWVCGKLSTGLFSELGYEPESVVCDVENELLRVEVERGQLGTKCRWNGIKLEKDNE